MATNFHFCRLIWTCIFAWPSPLRTFCLLICRRQRPKDGHALLHSAMLATATSRLLFATGKKLCGAKGPLDTRICVATTTGGRFASGNVAKGWGSSFRRNFFLTLAQNILIFFFLHKLWKVLRNTEEIFSENKRIFSSMIFFDWPRGVSRTSQLYSKIINCFHHRKIFEKDGPCVCVFYLFIIYLLFIYLLFFFILTSPLTSFVFFPLHSSLHHQFINQEQVGRWNYLRLHCEAPASKKKVTKFFSSIVISPHPGLLHTLSPRVPIPTHMKVSIFPVHQKKNHL